MIFVDQIGKQIDVMLHPRKAINKGLILSKALGYYATLGFLAFLLFLILGSIVIITNPSAVGLLLAHIGMGIGTAASFALLALAGVILFFGLMPISMLINAWVYRLVGKNLFRAFKGRFSDTVTAYAYAVSLMAFVYGLAPLLLEGPAAILLFVALFVIFIVWAYIILILGISRIHRISALAVLGILVAEMVILWLMSVVVFAFAALVAAL